MTLAAVTTQRGKLHIARRDGSVWVAACWRVFGVKRPDLITFEGDDAIPAYTIEHREGMVCRDCSGLLDAGRERFRQVTGWDLFDAMG